MPRPHLQTAHGYTLFVTPEPLMLELDSIGETIMNYNMTRDGTNIHILWKLLEKWMVQTGNLCKTARWLVL